MEFILPKPTIKQVIAINLIKEAPVVAEKDSALKPVLTQIKDEEKVLKEVNNILNVDKNIRHKNQEQPKKQPEKLVITNKNINKADVSFKQDDVKVLPKPKPVVKNNSKDVIVNKAPPTVVPLPDEGNQEIKETKQEEPKQKIEEKEDLIQKPDVKIQKDNDIDIDKLISGELFKEQEIPNIEDLNLTLAEKNAIKDQLARCWAPLYGIREKDFVVNLELNLEEDGRVSDIKILKNPNIKDINYLEEIKTLESRIIDIFNNPKCAKLTVPVNKYTIWKRFSVKLTLKGFF
jgi:hypothetical protein